MKEQQEILIRHQRAQAAEDREARSRDTRQLCEALDKSTSMFAAGFQLIAQALAGGNSAHASTPSSQGTPTNLRDPAVRRRRHVNA
jgi:hypothetical protein